MKAGKYIALFMCCLILFLGCAYIFVWSKKGSADESGKTTTNWYDLGTCQVIDPENVGSESQFVTLLSSLAFADNTVYKFSERRLSYTTNDVETLSIMFKTNADETTFKNSVLARVEKSKIWIPSSETAQTSSIVINSQVLNNQRNILLSKNGTSSYYATEADFESSIATSEIAGVIESLAESVTKDFESLNYGFGCNNVLLLSGYKSKFTTGTLTYKYAENSGNVKAIVYSESGYMYVEAQNNKIVNVCVDTKDQYLCISKYDGNISYAKDVESFKKAK